MILSIGEALVDLVEGADGRFTALAGGAPANVAVAVARLGGPSGFAGRLSATSFGTMLNERFVSEGVDISLVESAGENQTLAVVALDGGGTASYAFYTEGTCDWHWTEAGAARVADAAVDIVHFGSVAAALEPSRSVIERMIRRHRSRGALVSLDVNIRPALAGSRDRERERIERQVELSHLVKASADDLDWLYPHVDQWEIANRWAERGVTTVVTRGSAGVILVDPRGMALEVLAPTVDLVDTIGAGDTFCAALLTSLWEHGVGQAGRNRLSDMEAADWHVALQFAATAASLACTRQGAHAPTREDVNAALVRGFPK